MHHPEKLLRAAEHLRAELRKTIKLDVKKHFSLMAADAQLGTAIDEIQQLETCGDCGALVSSIIGCPDGAHICQGCFDAGNH
jgi:hypothetical protein